MAFRLLARDSAPAFNAALALAAAASAAFFLFAMPEAILSSLVEASGLPLLLPSAAPPLGMTARLAVVLAGAGLSGALSWAILSRLDRMPEEEIFVDDEDLTFSPPRLRRADAHPDAPARRPLFAEQDLGEPAEPLPCAELQQDTAYASPELDGPPPFLGEAEAPQPIEETNPELGPVVAYPVEGEERIQPDEEILVLSAQEMADEQPGFSGTAVETEPEESFPSSRGFASRMAAPEPLDFPSRKEPAAADPAAASNEALMARLPLPEDRGDSIASLFQRLDAGLEACEWPIGAHKEPPVDLPVPPAPDENELGEKLRDALGDLQRMASRRA